MKESVSISRIGGVVTAKPFHNNMSLSALVKEKYGEVEEQEIDVKGLTKEISNFSKLGETIFGVVKSVFSCLLQSLTQP